MLTCFDISCSEKLLDEVEEPFVRYTFAKNPQQRIVVEVIKETFDVPFHPPSCAIHTLNRLQGRVAATLWSETVRGVSEGRLVDGFEEQAHDRLEELVSEAGYPKWALSAVRLWDVDSPRRLWCVARRFELRNHLGDESQTHPIDGLPINASGHIAGLGRDTLVRQEPQFGVVQLWKEVVERDTFLAGHCAKYRKENGRVLH